MEKIIEHLRENAKELVEIGDGEGLRASGSYYGQAEAFNEVANSLEKEHLPKFKAERDYLQTTRDILVGYDGEHSVEGLKKLIDETRERLEKVLSGEELNEDDFFLTEEKFNEKLNAK